MQRAFRQRPRQGAEPGAVTREPVIGAEAGRMGAFVIPADEEIVITRDPVACREGTR
jgi:hypothetical protein